MTKARVRAIYALYLEHQGLRAVVQELHRRGWRTKRWTTRRGRKRGGRPFTKASLYQLLTNVSYVGQVQYQEEIHAGEHPAIVEASLWQSVQEALEHHGRSARERSPGSALLKGLLRCVPCGSAMTPAYTTRRGKVRYRYYVCSRAQKCGWHSCPSKALSAAAIEGFVIEQLQALVTDSKHLPDTVIEASARVGAVPAPSDAQKELQRDTARAGAALLAGPDARSPPEQARLVRRLVERVDYDGAAGTVTIRLHEASIRTWSLEPIAPQKFTAENHREEPVAH